MNIEVIYLNMTVDPQCVDNPTLRAVLAAHNDFVPCSGRMSANEGNDWDQWTGDWSQWRGDWSQWSGDWAQLY